LISMHLHDFGGGKMQSVPGADIRLDFIFSLFYFLLLFAVRIYCTILI